MSKKLLIHSAICLLFLASAEAFGNVDNKSKNKPLVYDSKEIDGFLNIKAAHERKNDYAFGPANSSAFALNPVITCGDFTIDGDFYYGRQFTFSPFLKSNRYLSRITSEDNRAEFYERFNRGISRSLNAPIGKNTEKSRFYRNYTRLIYDGKENNFRVVLGDTTTRNSIGFQNSFSGVGISIFRQSGDGNVVNSSSPIVITRLSKIECKLGNDVLATRVYAPGVYYLDDLVEEAKIPGVTLKISDQLNRSDVLTINYFSGYNGLKKGENDFDVTALYHHKWDVDDPHRLKYCKNPYLSTNYRYGISDDITVGVGLQQRKESYQLDGISVFSGEFGMISPNISFSSSSPSQRKSVKALGAGLFYALPQNSLGISFETYFAVKGKGFGDLGTADDMNESYNKFMDKYLNDANLRQRFANSSSDEVSKQIAARIYSKPICGITPAFIFSGQWTDSKRLREYTLSFTTKLFNRITITASAGLTYDDPYKGINRESPDRRLTVACTIPVGDFEISGTYSHHDDDRLRSYAKIAYTPSEIKGLEITLERDTKPGFSSPSVAIKYDGDHFDAKFDEGIKNTYADRLGTRSAAHSNQQRFFFGTSISPSGFKSYQKSSFNVLRSAKTTKK